MRKVVLLSNPIPPMSCVKNTVMPPHGMSTVTRKRNIKYVYV